MCRANDLYNWYYLEINPEQWAIGPVGNARRNGKASAYVGRNQQLYAYQEAVREELASQNPEMIEGNVSLRLVFWRRRDDYETASGSRHRKHDVDLTNLQKATEDALQGILFKNDRDVFHIESAILKQGADVIPGVLVGVTNKITRLISILDIENESFYEARTLALEKSWLKDSPELEYNGTSEEDLF